MRDDDYPTEVSDPETPIYDDDRLDPDAPQPVGRPDALDESDGLDDDADTGARAEVAAMREIS